MKIKIEDFRIPVSLMLAGIALTIMAVLTENEQIASISGICVAAVLIILVFVYFPIAIIKLFKQKMNDPDGFVNKTGIFSISFIVAGILFKIPHWPGAGILIVLGGALFYLSFLPSWYASKFKNSDNFQRLLYFIFCTSLGILIAAFQFKSMHWPGGNILLTITYYLNLFVVLPLGLYIVLFKRHKKYFSINSTFLFGFIIAYVVGGIMSVKIANGVFNSNNKTQLAVENNIKLYTSKNQFLYDALNRSNLNDSSFLINRNLAEKLKKHCDDLNNYIYELKTDLVIETDGLPANYRDSITFENIGNKSNIDIPTYYLIGSDAKEPRTGPKSAIELKSKINSFIDSAQKLVPDENKIQFKQLNPFDFSDIKLEDGGAEKWEVINFDHEPLATVFTTLTSYQANLRYIEMNVLNDLFTKANSGNKEDLASQLAELSLKFESEKQAKKIAMLQKDQEMNDMKIQAKDAEISSRENTITLFIFGAIIFGILMIFVIRSNILRKQTNKELAAQKDIITAQKNEVENQKHLVEEKQKEIVDSITYAKRLQEAILPAQEMLDKHLPENFILYTPKDLVAGDFYWMEVIKDSDKEYTFIAAADSTGHGVPGAMVSVVCSNALNRAVLEFKLKETGQILDKTRELVLETFSKSTTDVKDGMDISLLAVIRKNSEIVEINWSGANNPLWFIENNEVKEIKANKQPIGKTDNPTPFTTHTIPYIKGTSFYLFTDGYADQFGGPKGKKFKYKQLEELLLELSTKEMNLQKEVLNTKFEEWKEGIEQVDDVCIIGIKL